MLRVKKRHLSSQAATRDSGGSRLLAHLLALGATQRWPSWAGLNGVGTSILQRSSPIVSVTVTVTGCMRPGQMPRVNLDFRSKASSMRGPNFSPKVAVKAAKGMGMEIAIKPRIGPSGSL